MGDDVWHDGCAGQCIGSSGLQRRADCDLVCILDRSVGGAGDDSSNGNGQSRIGRAQRLPAQPEKQSAHTGEASGRNSGVAGDPAPESGGGLVLLWRRVSLHGYRYLVLSGYYQAA